MTPRQSKAMTPANQRLATLIRDAYEASGLTRAELAERSGIPDGTLANVLVGKRPIYAEQLVGLSEALRADLGLWLDEIRRALAETTE